MSTTLAKRLDKLPIFKLAASNAPFRERVYADIIADGTDDDLAFAAAIAKIPSTGGVLMLSGGVFNFGGFVRTTFRRNLAILGTPGQTVIGPQSESALAEDVVRLEFAGSDDNNTRNLIIKDLIFIKPNEAWVTTVAGGLTFERASNVLVENIQRFGVPGELGRASVVSFDLSNHFTIRSVKVFLGNASGTVTTATRSENGTCEDIAGYDIGEVIDLSTCNNMTISNIRGQKIGQELIDIGNVGNSTFTNISGDDIENVLQLKTESHGGLRPGFVSALGCNNNRFSNITATYRGTAINFSSSATQGLAAELRQRNNSNGFDNIRLRSIGGSAEQAMRITGNDDGTAMQNCQLSNFDFDCESGMGINIAGSNYEQLMVSNGIIRSPGRCFNDPATAVQPMRDGCTLENVTLIMTGTENYCGSIGHRKNVVMRNVRCINGGFFLVDPYQADIDIRVESARRRALYVEWLGRDAAFWSALYEGRVESDFQVRCVDSNTNGDPYGVFFNLSSANISVVRNWRLHGSSLRDSRSGASRTTEGFFFTDNVFEDCTFEGSFARNLISTRDTFLEGATNFNRNNRGSLLSENQGTATITSAATTISVDTLITGLSADDITVTPRSNLGTATKFWVTYTSGTSFTINVDAAPGASITFNWRAARIN